MSWALPQMDKSRCRRCGLCVEACPSHAVTLGEEGPVFACPEVDLSADSEFHVCTYICEDVCPSGAISCAFEIVLEADGPTVKEGG